VKAPPRGVGEARKSVVVERAFDDVGRAQMPPVLGREVVEGEQRVAILDQALTALSYLTPQVSTKAASASVLVSAIQISCSAHLDSSG
jgi:hypothetical protein